MYFCYWTTGKLEILDVVPAGSMFHHDTDLVMISVYSEEFARIVVSAGNPDCLRTIAKMPFKKDDSRRMSAPGIANFYLDNSITSTTWIIIFYRYLGRLAI
jgi:hypothetical protein